MKQWLMIACVITGVLVVSVHAQAKDKVHTTNSVIAKKWSSGKDTRPVRTEVSPSQNEKGYPQWSNDTREQSFVAGPCAKSVADSPENADPDKLSAGFASAALATASRMRSAERRLEFAMKKGYPLCEFCVQAELDLIDGSLTLASTSATNDADRQALQQLESHNRQLRLWSDWLVTANRNLRTANFYMSASALDNDEGFQHAVACTDFLISMLASRRLAQDYSCR